MKTAAQQIGSYKLLSENKPTAYDEALLLSIIEEAKRRAEQRVRAEIARDSERLDWLSGTVQEIRRVSNRPTQWVLEFSTPLRSLDRDDLLQAIDAAREVGCK